MCLPPHGWWSCHLSQTQHTLVALNGKRIITSGHEFFIQHILMIIIIYQGYYQVCRIKSINYVLLLLTVRTPFWKGSLAVELLVESVGSLISLISGWIIGTAFLASVEHLVDMTGFHIAGCDDVRCSGILPSFAMNSMARKWLLSVSHQVCELLHALSIQEKHSMLIFIIII